MLVTKVWIVCYRRNRYHRMFRGVLFRFAGVPRRDTIPGAWYGHGKLGRDRYIMARFHWGNTIAMSLSLIGNNPKEVLWTQFSDMVIAIAFAPWKRDIRLPVGVACFLHLNCLKFFLFLIRLCIKLIRLHASKSKLKNNESLTTNVLVKKSSKSLLPV